MVIESMRFLASNKTVQELGNLCEVSEEFYFARLVTLCYFGWVYHNNKIISNSVMKIFVLFLCSKHRALHIIHKPIRPNYLCSCFSSWNVFALLIPSWNSHSKKHILCKSSCIWWKQHLGMLSSRMHTFSMSLLVLFCLLNQSLLLDRLEAIQREFIASALRVFLIALKS